MTPPLVFSSCTPRPDVLKGAVTESDFAADLAQIVSGGTNAPADYADPARFFQNTYPTRGLRDLLANVCRRLSGAGGEAAAIFRLDTQYGGGKTHGLIALVHAARGMAGVPNVAEFIEPALVPSKKVRIAAFDGENADPSNGRLMGDGVRAHTPWGEIAYALAGNAGYEQVRKSDVDGVAPGAETLRALFGGEPTLILMDELSIYLRKVQAMRTARDQLAAFLTSLFKAVEATPNAAVVYTLAVGKGGRASDAYGTENEFIADKMAELESISARKATLLNPTEDDETPHVLRRRLFARVDDAASDAAVSAYRALWQTNKDSLPPEATRTEMAEAFRASYPFHPEVLSTLTEKTATLANFQRVRGMLRLLARTVARTWAMKPADAFAIHLHHIDLGYEPIRQEIVTRLGQAAYVPALRSDVAGDTSNVSLAQELDRQHYSGLPPYATYTARTIFVHTLAFNDQLKGLTPERLRFDVLGPGTDIAFVEDARKRFIHESAFMDDRPGGPMRFLAEANLTQIIRRQEQQVDKGEVRAQLNDRIKQLFAGGTNAVFDLVPFPGGAYEVPDDAGTRPRLVLLGYDAVSVGGAVDALPHLVETVYRHKGADSTALRGLRNHLVFVVADEARKSEMRQKMARRLALLDVKKPERMADLAEHQQAKVRELESRSEQEVAVAIQQCYRHVFYPSRANRVSDETDIAHTAVDVPSASANPGAGQQQVVRALRDNNKLRTTDDPPDSPTYIRDRTPLKQGQITTAALRDEFRRDPKLPILIGDDVFVRAIRNGVEKGEYVYRRGDLLYGPGDPHASIQVDEQAAVFTMAYATEKGIWPRQIVPLTPPGGTSGGEGVEPPQPPLPPPPPPPPSGDTITVEAALKEALLQLWEKARARKMKRVGRVTIKMFEVGDAFRLLAALGSVQGATKTVTFNGGYETAEGGRLELEFTGPVADAQPLKEFLEPQLRAARERTLTGEFELRFEGGLALDGELPEKITERLTRLVSGTAYVTATAEAETPAGARR